jgi:hypothetical protein
MRAPSGVSANWVVMSPKMPDSGVKKLPKTPWGALGKLSVSLRVPRSTIEKLDATPSLIRPTTARLESLVTATR